MPIEIALRKLNKRLLKSGVIADVRKKFTFVSPLVQRNRKKAMAKRKAIRMQNKSDI